jgi:hypothetical protein
VVVQRGVDVAVADDGVTALAQRRAQPAVAGAGGSPVRPVPAAVGDPPELLDVYVHELARTVPLIADDLATQSPAGGQVHLVQPRFAFTSQHPVHRRRVHAQAVPDPRWPPAALATQVQDLADQWAPDLRGAAQRAARAVLHRLQWVAAGFALAQAGGPAAGSLRRSLEPLSRPAQRPAVLDDAAGKGEAAPGSQGGVSVRQEDLRVGEAVASPTSLGGPLHVRVTRRVTNVRGQYN